MNKKIQNEQKKSLKNHFTKTDELIDLTVKNVALAEAMINNNSSYRKSRDGSAAPQKKYRGSTAYWIKQMSNANYCETMAEIIKSINAENSTRACLADCNKMSAYICKKYETLDDLKQGLKKRENGIELVCELKEQKIVGTRNSNYSLASKIVHYLAYFLFEDSSGDEQDYYSIYDNVVKKSITKYAQLYNIQISESGFNDYKTYSEVIDKILQRSGSKISRNGFDHLLWYANK